MLCCPNKLSGPSLALSQFSSLRWPEASLRSSSIEKSKETDCVLMRPDGRTSFDTPQQAFRVLAGVGIRSAIIEWDGLEALTE